ncbi:MAG: ABC transporter substrate-binding protein, partial [Tepidisphaerales bacterium]
MRKVKWLFFAYLMVIGIIVAALAASLAVTSPRDPNTVYSAYYDNLKSMDPAVCNDVDGSALIANVYECLYGYRYAKKPYELYPQLAADFPEIAPDGLTYTIRLRQGIRFYDPTRKAFAGRTGPEMTADDVVYSFKRIANFHLASPNYSTLFQEKVAGLDEFNAYSERTPAREVDFDRPVEGLQALDRYTVRIKLTKPCPQFKYMLAHGGGSIISRKACEMLGDEAIAHHLIGTGPFVLAEHLPEQRIVFTASPAYRGRPDVDGDAKLSDAERLPKIKRMQFDYFKELIPAWHLFRQGLFDLAIIPRESFSNAIDPATQELWPELKTAGMKLSKTPEASMYYYGFNMGDPVVGKNPALRQAMAMAHDREKFIRIYRNGRGIALRSMIPPGFRAYDATLNNPYAQYNPELARKKLAEAERIHGGKIPDLKLLAQATDTETRQMTEYFVSEMRQVLGLTLKAEYVTWARYQELVDARQTQVFEAGWAADYPDEQTYLAMFYSKFAPAGGVNSSAYVNPAYDQLY